MEAHITQNLARVLERIDAARENLLNMSPCTKLIAVSKGRSEEEIRPLLEAGQRFFGENRVQEAEAKWPALKRAFPDVELHMIGHMQINKVRETVALFDALHSLDRPELAQALKRECENAGRSPGLFVQVNTGREAQKSGVSPEGAPALVALARSLSLNVIGLMCIPPRGEAPEAHFTLLAQLADEFALPYLSMGMSADFETAVRLGATHVRVGTAIFGERQ